MSLKEAILQCFIEPWDVYKKQDASNKVNLQLSRFITKKFTTDATKAAQMTVDKEQTVDWSQLQDLNKAQTLKEAKNLQNKIIDLKSKINNLKQNTVIFSSKNLKGRGTQSSSDSAFVQKNKKRRDYDLSKSTKNSKKQNRSPSPKRSSSNQRKNHDRSNNATQNAAKGGRDKNGGSSSRNSKHPGRTSRTGQS
eukprot:14975165-Ditylum_brightwellii.AAC.1